MFMLRFLDLEMEHELSFSRGLDMLVVVYDFDRRLGELCNVTFHLLQQQRSTFDNWSSQGAPLNFVQRSYFWYSPNPDLKMHANPVLNQKLKICSWLWKAVKICLISNTVVGTLAALWENNIKFELFRQCLKLWLWAVWVDYRLQNCAIFAAAAASCCALP